MEASPQTGVCNCDHTHYCLTHSQLGVQFRRWLYIRVSAFPGYPPEAPDDGPDDPETRYTAFDRDRARLGS